MPTAGLNDQFTPVFVVPVTELLNCTDWPPVSDELAGVVVMLTGTSDAVALAVLLGSAALVAVTVIVWEELIMAGAV